MAHNNAIVRNKTIIQEILSADAKFILNKVREKELITGREYTKLNSIGKGNAEDLVIQLVDTLNNKGVQRQSDFIGVLQDKDVLETYPDLKDVEWGGSGSTASSNSLKRSAERSLSKDAPEIKSQKTEDKYQITSKPTGLCVIINNENFPDNNKRSGSEKDAKDLATVFSWLGFQVLMCLDQTASDISQVTKLLADLKDLAGLQKSELKEWSDGRFTPLRVLPRHGDAFVCCVLSHGEEKVVLGVDGKKRPISDITSAFNGKHCPALLGKPKVFFIQACQGHSLQPGDYVMDDLVSETPEQDTHQLVFIPVDADFLVAMATVEKYQAVRHTANGSWFIQSLCEQLKEGCPRGEDIMQILYRVNDNVSQKKIAVKCGVMTQMPETQKVTLRRRLVFSPCSS